MRWPELKKARDKGENKSKYIQPFIKASSIALYSDENGEEVETQETRAYLRFLSMMEQMSVIKNARDSYKRSQYNSTMPKLDALDTFLSSGKAGNIRLFDGKIDETTYASETLKELDLYLGTVVTSLDANTEEEKELLRTIFAFAKESGIDSQYIISPVYTKVQLFGDRTLLNPPKEMDAKELLTNDLRYPDGTQKTWGQYLEGIKHYLEVNAGPSAMSEDVWGKEGVEKVPYTREIAGMLVAMNRVKAELGDSPINEAEFNASVDHVLQHAPVKHEHSQARSRRPTVQTAYRIDLRPGQHHEESPLGFPSRKPTGTALARVGWPPKQRSNHRP